MGSKLAFDVVVGRPTSFQDEAPLLAPQLQDCGVHQTPTVIGENLRIGHPVHQQVALLGRQPAQSVVHGVEPNDRLCNPSEPDAPTRTAQRYSRLINSRACQFDLPCDFTRDSLLDCGAPGGTLQV